MQIKKIICPICGNFQNTKMDFIGRDYYEKYVNGKFYIFYCNKCDIKFIYPFPSNKEIESYYPKNYYAYYSGNKKSFLTRLRENTIISNFEGLGQFNLFWKIILLFTKNKFKFFLPSQRIKNGHFLDVGCGRGENLELLSRFGWKTFGIEIAEDIVNNIKNRGLNVAHATLDAYKTTQKFDAIRLWHVLEHLPDPDTAMEKIHFLLKDNGTVYIAIPNMRSLNTLIFGKYWVGYDVPRHLFNFSIKSSKLLLEKNGFRILSCRYSSSSGFISSISNYLNSKTKKKYRLADNLFLVVLTYPFDCITDLFKAGDTIYFKIQKNEKNINY